MVVTLTPMTTGEYEKFYEMSLSSQIDDLVKGGSSREEAQKEAEADLNELLPLGQDTEENFLMMIKTEDDLTEAGYIWTLHEFNGDTKQSFLCDLMVYEEYRGKGYAKEALSLMERSAYTYGCEESILYVDKDNTKAVALYETCGYRSFRDEGSGMYMKKYLTKDILEV